MKTLRHMLEAAPCQIAWAVKKVCNLSLNETVSDLHHPEGGDFNLSVTASAVHNPNGIGATHLEVGRSLEDIHGADAIPAEVVRAFTHAFGEFGAGLPKAAWVLDVILEGDRDQLAAILVEEEVDELRHDRWKSASTVVEAFSDPDELNCSLQDTARHIWVGRNLSIDQLARAIQKGARLENPCDVAWAIDDLDVPFEAKCDAIQRLHGTDAQKERAIAFLNKNRQGDITKAVSAMPVLVHTAN